MPKTEDLDAKQQTCRVFSCCRDVMQEATNPAGVHMPRHMTCAQTTAVASLRPMVAHCRALLEEAAKEPPFIGRHWLLLAKWQPLLNALETLITKAAALESLLEGI